MTSCVVFCCVEHGVSHLIPLKTQITRILNGNADFFKLAGTAWFDFTVVGKGWYTYSCLFRPHINLRRVQCEIV